MADKYSKKKSTIINATTWLIKSRNFGRTCAKHTWLAFTPWEPTKYTKIWRQESYCLLHPPSLLVVFWLIFHCFKGDSDRKWCKQMENILILSKIITEKSYCFRFRNILSKFLNWNPTWRYFYMFTVILLRLFEKTSKIEW